MLDCFMADDEFTSIMKHVNALVDECRARCLWYLREDYYPQTSEEALRVLDAIERRSDLETFKKAGKLRQWLLQNSKETSAA